MTYLKQKPGSIEELRKEKGYYRDNLWEVTARVTHFAFGIKNSLITVEVEASNKKEAIRSLRKKLQQGSPSVGSWMQIPNTSIAEILGKAGYNWITIDLEHGNISSESLPDLMRAIELGDTLPLVRLSSNSLSECKTVMDAGSSGVIVPMVTNAKQLQEIKEAISFFIPLFIAPLINFSSCFSSSFLFFFPIALLKMSASPAVKPDSF